VNALAGAALVLGGIGVFAALGVLGAWISDANPALWDRLCTGRPRPTIDLDVDAPRGAIVRDLTTGRTYRVVARHDGYVTGVPA
jgi:hypothetical protein